MERYEILKDIGSGNFGVAKLVKDKWSGELYAVKFIERGLKVTYASFIFFLFHWYEILILGSPFFFPLILIGEILSSGFWFFFFHGGTNLKHSSVFTD